MSDQYDGLNLVDLLALMHDIVVPSTPPFVPQTPAWWVLSAWLVSVFLIVTWHIRARWQRNRYRRAAESELDAITAAADADPAGSAAKIAVLLKRTALAAYPRHDVAALAGNEWADFLARSSADDKLVRANAETIAHAAYRQDADGRELVAAARRWIRVHRV